MKLLGRMKKDEGDQASVEVVVLKGCRDESLVAPNCRSDDFMITTIQFR